MPASGDGSARRCFIFDLDGTLIDSAPDIHAAINRVLAQYRRDPITLDETRVLVGEGAGTLIQRAFVLRPGPEIDRAEALARFLDFYAEDPAGRTVVYPGVVETLAVLQSGGATLALCTNKSGRLAHAVLQTLGLAPFFPLVVSGDTYPYRKPDPRMLTGMLETLGFERRQAVYIGDSEIDAQTAEAAGLDFVLVTYGYCRAAPETLPAIARLDRFDALPAALGIDPEAPGES